MDIVLAAVGNAIVSGKVIASKDLGSSSNVISSSENEGDDKDHQAKYLSNKFNI